MVHNKYDQLVIKFAEDSIKVLKKYDKKIYDNFISSGYKTKDEWKGIGTWSITEPIIKFLIYFELSKNFKIYPEKPYTKDPKKRMDIGLYKTINEYNREDDPELDISPIAIELKWSHFNEKDMKLNKWSIKKIQEIIVRFRDYCQSENKYIFQMGIYEKEKFDKYILKSKIISNAKKDMDSRIIRHFNLKILKIFKFMTCGGEKDSHYFYIIVWKI